VLAGTSLRKESVESVISATDCLVTGHLSIWLDAMLEAEKLPASITDLDTSLSKVEAKDLTHGCKQKVEGRGEGESPDGMPEMNAVEICRVMRLTNRLSHA